MNRAGKEKTNPAKIGTPRGDNVFLNAFENTLPDITQEGSFLMAKDTVGINTPQSQPFVEKGLFKIADWCIMCDCSEDTIKRNIKDFRIPVRQCAGTTWIDARKWWIAIWGPDDLPEEE